MRRFIVASLVTLACLAGCEGQIDDPTHVVDPPPDELPPCELCVGESLTLRLTRSQYERSVRTVLGDVVADGLRTDHLPSDGSAGPFASNAFFDVDDDGVEGYRAVAESAGELAALEAATLLDCDAAVPSCVEGFVRALGRDLYRRPLDDEEAAAYVALFALGETEADSVRLMVTAMLQSPHFLYRIEVGVATEADGVRELTPHELASRLAFFLWQSGPDRALLEAADRGALATEEGIEAEARRMLADSRADVMLARFHLEWLGVDELENKRVDDTLFPEFEGMKFDMMAETEAFVLHVFRNGDARLETLLTAPYSFVTPALADHYGLPSVPADTLTMVETNAAERMGVLTQAGFISAHTTDPSSAAVHRGLAIRERFLCQHLPPPPPVDTIIAPDATLSSREKLEIKTSPDACQVCHLIMNPVGFTFEHYDAIGAFRTMDGTHLIDATGRVSNSDVAGEIDGALELVQGLANSEDVKQCLTRQWLRFALSRPTDIYDERSANHAYDAYTESGGDLRELIVAITTSPSFRHRGIPSP